MPLSRCECRIAVNEKTTRLYIVRCHHCKGADFVPDLFALCAFMDRHEAKAYYPAKFQAKLARVVGELRRYMERDTL